MGRLRAGAWPIERLGWVVGVARSSSGPIHISHSTHFYHLTVSKPAGRILLPPNCHQSLILLQSDMDLKQEAGPHHQDQEGIKQEESPGAEESKVEVLITGRMETPISSWRICSEEILNSKPIFGLYYKG